MSDQPLEWLIERIREAPQYGPAVELARRVEAAMKLLRARAVYPCDVVADVAVHIPDGRKS